MWKLTMLFYIEGVLFSHNASLLPNNQMPSFLMPRPCSIHAFGIKKLSIKVQYPAPNQHQPTRHAWNCYCCAAKDCSEV